MVPTWGANMLLSLLAMPCAIAFVLEPFGFIRLAGMLNAQSGSSRLPVQRRFKGLQRQGMANALRYANHDAEGGANLKDRCSDGDIVETILQNRRVFLHSSLLTGLVVSSAPQKSTAADLRKFSALAPLGAPTSTGEKSNGQSIFSLATALTNDLLYGHTGLGPYFLSGDIDTRIFSDSCRFLDPTNDVSSLSRYQKALSILFNPERSTLRLLAPLSVDPASSTITARLESQVCMFACLK